MNGLSPAINKWISGKVSQDCLLLLPVDHQPQRANRYLQNDFPALTLFALDSMMPDIIGFGPKIEFSCTHACCIILFAPLVDLAITSYHLCGAAITASIHVCGKNKADRRTGKQMLDKILEGSYIVVLQRWNEDWG
jgi:hypothetical protein